jgi:hypothetical protein
VTRRLSAREGGLGDGDVALVDLLDRLLDTGAAVLGDVVLSVAGVDLVWVGLRALVASVETLKPGGRHLPSKSPPHLSLDTLCGDSRLYEGPPRQRVPERSASVRGATEQGGVDPLSPRGATVDGTLGETPQSSGSFPERSPAPRRIALEEADVGRGLSQLVLTVVELLRQLMERQAISRMDAGSLTDDEVERLGIALSKLAQQMDELKEIFRLEDEDLGLRLGAIREPV